MIGKMYCQKDLRNRRPDSDFLQHMYVLFVSKLSEVNLDYKTKENKKNQYTGDWK
jgi:hypothetical protein